MQLPWINTSDILKHRMILSAKTLLRKWISVVSKPGGKGDFKIRVWRILTRFAN